MVQMLTKRLEYQKELFTAKLKKIKSLKEKCRKHIFLE